MRLRRVLLGVVVGLSSSCKDASSERTGVSHEESAGETTIVGLAEVRAEFDRLCAASYGVVAQGTQNLAPAPWPEPRIPGRDSVANDPVVIGVQGVSVAVDGKRFGTLEGERAEYQALAARRGGTVPWILAVTPDTGVANVASTLQAIGESLGPNGRIHFAHPTASLPPSVDPAHTRQVSEKVLAASEDRRLFLLAKELEALSGKCEPFRKAFDAAGSASPDRRCEVLAQGVPGAVVECGLDHTKILATLYVLFVGPNDARARAELAVELAVDDDADAVELRYTSGATWGDIVSDWFTSPPSKPIRLRLVGD